MAVPFMVFPVRSSRFLPGATCPLFFSGADLPGPPFTSLGKRLLLFCTSFSDNFILRDVGPITSVTSWFSFLKSALRKYSFSSRICIYPGLSFALLTFFAVALALPDGSEHNRFPCLSFRAMMVKFSSFGPFANVSLHTQFRVFLLSRSV